MDTGEAGTRGGVGFISREMAPFLTVFTGQAFSLLGSRLVNFTLVWWLTANTGSASVLATATIMMLIPQIVLGPFAGAFVDRWDRRRVMMVSDSLVALAVIVLAVLYSRGVVQIWHIYAIMMVRSAGNAFQWPAMQASTTLMVPDEHLPRVAGLNQSLSGIAAIVAPPLGAVLLEILPIQWVLSLDVITAVFAVGPLLFIHVPRPQRRQSDARTVLDDMKQGYRYVWDWKGLRTIMMISLMINMITNPAFSLLPLLVTDYFKKGALELALFQSANGVGMILGGLALGVIGGRKRVLATAFTGIAFAGLAIAGISQTPSDMINLAIASTFVFGFSNSIANSLFFAFLQSFVPPEMQGRVFTLIMSISGAVAPLGLAVAGPVADAFGVRVWFLAGGIVMVASSIFAFVSPSLKELEWEMTSDVSADASG